MSSPRNNSRRSILLAAVFLLVSSVIQTQPACADEVTRVFLFAGQSNMVGADAHAERIDDYPDFRGAGAEQSDVLYSDILGNGDEASQGWVPLKPLRSFGPEVTFARRVKQQVRGPIAIIKSAVGGTTVAFDWNPDAPDKGQKLYPRTLRLIRESLAELDQRGVRYRLEGVMWHQGENDMLDRSLYKQYADGLTKLIARLRFDLKAPELKWYIAEVSEKGIWGLTFARMTRRCLLIGVVLAVLLDSKTNSLRAEEAGPPAKSRDEVLKVQRFELMQTKVAALKIESAEADFPTHFAAKPIFKYNDPARHYVAASVWKLGDQGRPKALLAVELHRSTFGKPTIGYEYGSLTKTPFKMSAEKVNWTPKGTLYEFKPIPDAPTPEKTPQLRLIQLRAIAKRFASNEVVDKEKCELRLLPAPVDRYKPSKANRADGAIFFFTFGTNPEVVLLIESDDEGWSYAAGRMTGAQEVVLTFDNRTVWEGAPLDQRLDAPFTGSVEFIDIPGVAADGSEIPD